MMMCRLMSSMSVKVAALHRDRLPQINLHTTWWQDLEAEGDAIRAREAQERRSGQQAVASSSKNAPYPTKRMEALSWLGSQLNAISRDMWFGDLADVADSDINSSNACTQFFKFSINTAGFTNTITYITNIGNL